MSFPSPEKLNRFPRGQLSACASRYFERLKKSSFFEIIKNGQAHDIDPNVEKCFDSAHHFHFPERKRVESDSSNLFHTIGEAFYKKSRNWGNWERIVFIYALLVFSEFDDRSNHQTYNKHIAYGIYRKLFPCQNDKDEKIIQDYFRGWLLRKIYEDVIVHLKLCIPNKQLLFIDDFHTAAIEDANAVKESKELSKYLWGDIVLLKILAAYCAQNGFTIENVKKCGSSDKFVPCLVNGENF